MGLPSISGVGRLTADPELRYSAAGTAVCTVNLAFNSRRKNQQTGEWEDGDTFFVRGTVFKQLAENVAESLSRGCEVTVSGRLKTEQWQDKQTGDKRSATALLVDSIGPSLAWATAKVQKAERSSGGGQRSGSSDDPWQPSSADEQAPF